MSEKNSRTEDPELVRKVIAQESITILFQPVVSVERKSVIGFEAFARGVVNDTNQIIRPKVMFDQCEDQECKLKLDRLCRDKALEGFKGIYAAHKGIMIFLNLDPVVLDTNLSNQTYLADKVSEFGFDPERVVIEMDLDSIPDNFPQSMLDYHKKQGFKFSLDDAGATGNSLDKLFMVRPDFIKLNRNAFSDMDARPYKRDLLKSLCKAAGDMGCKVIGKTVESEDEAFELLNSNIVLQQGYFFTKSEKHAPGADATSMFKEKVTEVHAKYLRSLSKNIKAKKKLFEGYHRMAAKALNKVENTSPDNYSKLMHKLVENTGIIKRAFVLDENGEPASAEAVKRTNKDGNTETALLHYSSSHSMKDYFLYMTMGYDRFVTQAFTSNDSREPRCIIARKSFTAEGTMFVLCLEFPYWESA